MDVQYTDGTLVARYLIAKANDKNQEMNITKLMKLLYICYGVYMAVRGKRLFAEQPQAWPYGPVFPNIRSALRDEIFALVSLTNINKEINSDEDLKALTDSVLKTFGGWSASQLTEWMHAKNTPWTRTTELEGFEYGDTISDNETCSYFKTIMGKGNE